MHKSITAESDMSVIKSNSEMTNMNLQLMQRRMNDLPSRVNDSKTKNVYCYTVEDYIEGLKKQVDSSQLDNMQQSLRSSIESLRVTLESRIARESKTWSEQVRLIRLM